MITAAAVAVKLAVTTPELALLVTLVAPATVKKFATMPVSVYPDLAVSVMVAVYTVLAAKVPLTTGLQLTVPVYWAVAVIVVTGVAPVTGAVTPGIADRLITAAVVGKLAVTTPELALLVTLFAPATVKKFAVTPVSVYPALAVSVMVAVYTVEPANVPCAGLQLTVPVYWAVAVIVVTGVAPVTGAVTPGIAAMLITVAAVAVKLAVTTPEFAEFESLFAPATVKKFAVTPVSVYPALAVSVMVAVYTVEPANVPCAGLQLTVPVYWSVAVIVVTGVAPVTGAVTPGMAAILITVSGADPVAGNTAVTMPESAELVAAVDVPATVKEFAATPLRVYPAFAVRVMVAVYAVPAATVASAGLQLTVPVYWSVSVIVVTGVAP